MYYNFCFEIRRKIIIIIIIINILYIHIQLKISCMVAIRVKICKCNFVPRFIYFYKYIYREEIVIQSEKLKVCKMYNFF